MDHSCRTAAHPVNESVYGEHFDLASVIKLLNCSPSWHNAPGNSCGWISENVAAGCLTCKTAGLTFHTAWLLGELNACLLCFFMLCNHRNGMNAVPWFDPFIQKPHDSIVRRGLWSLRHKQGDIISHEWFRKHVGTVLISTDSLWKKVLSTESVDAWVICCGPSTQYTTFFMSLVMRLYCGQRTHSLWQATVTMVNMMFGLWENVSHSGVECG